MKLYVLLIYLAHFVHGEYGTNSLELLNHRESNAPKSCTAERVERMLGYSCSNLNLREIPQQLNSGLEILDASFNRIRELKQDSFARYTDLKLLYLFENMIQTIEKNTFLQLNSLEVINLSINGLTTLPMELFSLPLLRTLYASDNTLYNLENDLKNLPKPVAAPLQRIHIASCKLNKVPDFGVLPDLWEMNVSSNDLLDITPQQLSPFCSLKNISLNNTKIPTCTCQTLAYYFERRSLRTADGMNCGGPAQELIDCLDAFNSTIDTDDFAACKSLQKLKKLKEKSKLTWMSVFGGLLAFFVVFMGMLYLFHRRNVTRIRELEQITKLKQIHQTEKNQTVELLISKEVT